MSSTFYITTPIYYVNARPHLGHAYTTIVADSLRRFHTLLGEDTWFLTGTDEHGDKIVKAAEAAGQTPQEFVDGISGQFQALWPKLGIKHDQFIRTTDADHKARVQAFLQKVYDNGDIYFGEFGGHYCTGCERFYTEKELVNGLCPQHLTKPEYIKEKNYFFRMSKYMPWLRQYVLDHPDFVRPDRYRSELLGLIDSGGLEDLCISRPKSRLSWGIELPFDKDYVTYVWFDALLNYITALGWPDGPDYKKYWPGEHLVAKDILKPHGVFWPCMLHSAGLPVYQHLNVHGYWLMRDTKMSKSLGNGIDPLEVIAQYGADALRFMLVDGSTPGNDMRYSEKKVEAARNFANKLWNATRFVLMNLPEDFQPGLPSEEKLDMSDKWVLTKLNQVAGAMSDNLDHYEMGLAAAKINSFIWDVYCDWFIEIAKPRLNSGDAEQADTARRVLVYVLDKALKLLHPFMPFITEELYQALPGSAETIMTQSWPTFDEAHNWADEEEAFEKVMDYIKAVRTMRTEMNVHPAKKTSMIIETADAAPFQNAQVYLAKFAFATDVTFTEKYEGSTDGMVQVSTHAARGFIPMMELIDREKELARLNKEKAKAEKEMAMFGNQLNNPKFVERAPAALVEEIRTKFAKSQDKLANIEQSIKALG